MDSERKATLYGLITVSLWSTIASAFKLSLRYMDHYELLLYSTIVSIFVLATILALLVISSGVVMSTHVDILGFSFSNPL